MMPYFRSQPPPPRLPEGYQLNSEDLPVEADRVNAFLQRCGGPIRQDERVALALERSAWSLRIVRNGELVGFVRATSDEALNANLWDLAVLPGEEPREKLYGVLVNSALNRLRRELPGCSISLAACPEAIPILEQQGFITDPNGIRAMGMALLTSMEGLEPPTFRTGI